MTKSFTKKPDTLEYAQVLVVRCLKLNFVAALLSPHPPLLYEDTILSTIEEVLVTFCYFKNVIYLKNKNRLFYKVLENNSSEETNIECLKISYSDEETMFSGNGK